jgi:DNA-binding NarL/FixJ family response regulator
LHILVADDHNVVREGLKHALAELGEATSVCEAATGDEVNAALARERFDLALIDLHMPGADGLNLITSVCNRYPELPVVVLSASENPAHMRKAIDRGASGYIPKTAGRAVMLSALRLVLSGGVYIPRELFTAEQAPSSGAFNEPATASPGPPTLTARQLDVLRLLAQGHPNKAIARLLSLSESTVKIHVAALLKALNVSNRTQAVVAARELGLESGWTESGEM